RSELVGIKVRSKKPCEILPFYMRHPIVASISNVNRSMLVPSSKLSARSYLDMHTQSGRARVPKVLTMEVHQMDPHELVCFVSGIGLVLCCRRGVQPRFRRPCGSLVYRRLSGHLAAIV